MKPRDWRRYIDMVLVVVMLAIALVNGLRPVRGESWPPLYDALRDIGTAQVILEGRYPADNIYPREYLWFNPGMGAIVAAGAWLTGWDAPHASTQLGPWVNLFPAMAFYLLCRWWMGAWGGVAGLGVYLLWNGMNIAHNATYGPWLVASQLAQGFFCLALLVYLMAREEQRCPLFVLSGVLHGITFMVHTGAAVVMGGIVVGMAALNWRDGRREVQQALLLLAAAFLTSLPFTLPVLWRYQMHMINVFPAINVESPMRLSEARDLLLGAMNPVNAVPLAGFVHLLRITTRERRTLLLVWAGVLAGWVAQVYLWQWTNLGMRGYPQPVPGHHVHFAVTLFRALCFAAATIGVARFVARQLTTRFQRAIVPVVVCLMCLLPLPWYIRQPQFTQTSRAQSAHSNVWDARNALYHWLRDNAEPSELILSDDWHGLLAAAPAARGLVSTMLIFSNPYVNASERIADRDRMWDALRAKDAETFRQLTQKYGASYLLAGESENQLVQAANWDAMQAVLSAPPLMLYRISQ